MRFVWGAPSRLNDRAYTLLALNAAVKACRDPDLVVAVGKVGWGLDCVLGLHPDAQSEWSEWIEADRGWWSLYNAVLHPPDRATSRVLRAQVAQRMERLGSRLRQAANDEAVLDEARLIVDGTIVGEGT